MTDSLDVRLAALDRDQLEEMVRRLVRHDPDLEDLVHLPLPGERVAVDESRVREQVNRIVRGIGWDWRASSRAEGELWPLVVTGRRLVDEGAWADARRVFGATIRAILAHYGEFRDNESEVAGIVSHCVEGLGACLDEPDQRRQDRAKLLDEVLSVWIWDRLEQGGYGMDGPARAVLLERATPPERRAMAARVRRSLPRTDADCGRSRRQAGGRFVLELLGDELASAERERLLAEASLDRELLALLFEQGRRAEAIELVRRTSSEDVVKLAGELVARGMARQGERAVLDHPALLDPDSWPLRRWLADREVEGAAELEDGAEAVRWFRAYPNIGNYRKLRTTAEALGRWPGVLRQVVDVKPDAKAVRPVRARMYADLGRVAEALAVLDELSGSTWRSAAGDVAQSLGPIHPDDAAELYRSLIAHLVEHDTKHSRQAAQEHQQRLSALSTRIPAS